jgi:hypothetical protein
MTTERPDEVPDESAEATEPRHRVRVPGLKDDVGLGDVVARATTRAGIKPCAPCKRRQAALNRWMSFGN